MFVVLKIIQEGVRCNNPNIRVDELESIVMDNLKNVTIDNNVLLEELIKIKSGMIKNNFMQCEIDNLPGQIKIKQSQIDILISQLSLDNEISKYLRPQILKLGNELEKLKDKYENLKATSYKYKNNNWDANKFLYSLSNFSSLVDILDFNNKRLLINSIVQSIYWDGSKGNVKINVMSLKR